MERREKLGEIGEMLGTVIYLALGAVIISFLFKGCQVEKAEATSEKIVDRSAIEQVEVFEISAYTSRRCETDNTPTITSTGEKVRQGIIAVGRKIMPDGAYTREPFLPYGTRLKINGEVYVVADIMNKRFQGRYLDIWMGSYKQAIQFGRQKLEVEIL